MKKIACVGYHATGAGVIDDFFREFDNVAQGGYEAESRYLQDLDGISDLEFHLVECPNRLKTAVVIERFLRYAFESRRMYEKVYGKHWMSICQDYVKSITKFQYVGNNTHAVIARNPYARIRLFLCRAINKLKPPKYRHPNWYNYFPGFKVYHACIGGQEFIEKTQHFIEVLCEQIPHNEKTEYCMIDQMIAGNYPERYLRYVKDLKVIIVDRDPRDLYIHMVLHNDQKLPHDVSQFCDIYKDIRHRMGRIDEDKVLYLNFEDMIYSYHETTKKVMSFVGVSESHHVAPFSHFDPQKSIKGTKQWLKHPEFNHEISYIEKELPEFLYDYSSNSLCGPSITSI